MKGISSEDEILNKVVELINHPQLKAEDLKAAAVLYYKKLVAAYFYTPEPIYNGDVLLIKAKDNFVPLNKDYGLSKVIIKFKY